MKGKSFLTCMLAACLLLAAVSDVNADAFPPIAAPLIRQGTLAVSLASSLGLGAGSEAAAISNLSQLGIIPRGGWSASILVTPALIGELQNSIFLAARSGQLFISGSKVLTRFDSVRVGLGFPIFPANAAARAAFRNANFISPFEINRFFINNGLPLMTFFPPPAQFRRQFAFTPFPFVSSNVFFPGFFVRQDVSSRFFARVSNGMITPALIQLDNATGFRSVRFSTDALLNERLRNPLFNTAFRTPVGFAGRTFARDDLFFARVNSPLFASAFRTPVGFSSPASINLDFATGFSSVRFSTNPILTQRLPVRAAAFSARSAGVPRAFARGGGKGGGRCAGRRR
jgi:hypothetical protein